MPVTALRRSRQRGRPRPGQASRRIHPAGTLVGCRWPIGGGLHRHGAGR
ncbi:hypothetical protein P0D87_09475 [Paraburkholderia sp. RL17-368-BIF-A]